MRIGLFLAYFLAVLFAGAAWPALSQAQAQPATPPETIETAPVTIDGEVLFALRGIPSYPAGQRAAAVAGRILEIARDSSVPVSALRIVEAGDRTDILAGDKRIMSVIDADAATEQLEQRTGLADLYKAAMATAIERYRNERGFTHLRNQALHAAAAAALLIILLLAFLWTFHRIARAIDRRLQARLAKLESKSYQLVSAEQIKTVVLSGIRTAHWLLAFLALFACVVYILALFPWTRAVAHRGAALLTDPLNAMWIGLINALPGLAFIAILIVITRYVLGLAWLFFGGIAAGRIRPGGFDQNWAWPTYRLFRIAMMAFAVVLAYPHIPGSSSDAFKGVSLFLGLLMSLGASSLVANSLAGYMLVYRSAFKVGDRIRVGDVLGDVVAIRQQVTHVNTPKNEEVTIPSSVILNSHVINYSSLARERALILHTTVGIGYETPWRQVEAMLLEAARRTPGLLVDPPPFVLQTSLGEFCVTYEINVHCDRPREMAMLYSALHQSILDVFNEFGVQIMTPAYEGDPEQPKIVPKDKWHSAPAPPADAKEPKARK